MAQYLQFFGSLPAQKEAIRSASDYELLRARRLIFFVAGHLGRVARATKQLPGLEKWTDRLVIGFGGRTVPTLITVLRKKDLRRKIVS